MTLPCHLCHVSSKHLIVIFPRNEPQDGVTLGHLHVPVHVVGKVGKVEAEAELVIKPAALVKAWGGSTA